MLDKKDGHLVEELILTYLWGEEEIMYFSLPADKGIKSHPVR